MDSLSLGSFSDALNAALGFNSEKNEYPTINPYMPYIKRVFEENRAELSKLLIVSVGCGNEKFEKEIGQILEKPIIGIDPHEKYFPTHKCKIEDLEPEFIEKYQGCFLILIWPLPNNGYDFCYDINAIKILKPRHIFTFFDYTGSSGSLLFIKYIEAQTGFKSESFWRQREEQVKFGKEYEIINHKVWKTAESDFKEICSVLLRKF